MIQTKWAISHLFHTPSPMSLFTTVSIIYMADLILSVDMLNKSSLTHLVLKEMQNEGK